jgi:hypothetical protein
MIDRQRHSTQWGDDKITIASDKIRSEKAINHDHERHTSLEERSRRAQPPNLGLGVRKQHRRHEGDGRRRAFDVQDDRVHIRQRQHCATTREDS